MDGARDAPPLALAPVVRRTTGVEVVGATGRGLPLCAIVATARDYHYCGKIPAFPKLAISILLVGAAIVIIAGDESCETQRIGSAR